MSLHAVVAGAAWALWAMIQASLSSLGLDYRSIATTYRDDVIAAVESEAFPRWLRDASGGAEG